MHSVHEASVRPIQPFEAHRAQSMKTKLTALSAELSRILWEIEMGQRDLRRAENARERAIATIRLSNAHAAADSWLDKVAR